MARSERRSEAQWIEARNRWQVKVQVNGVRKTFTSSIPGRKGKHDAEGKADDWLESQTSDKRFADAWAEYLAENKGKIANTTYVKYEGQGRLWLVPKLGRKHLSEITPAMWQRCIDDMADAGLSKKSCANLRGLISVFCVFCRRHRWDIETPLDGDLTVPRKATQGTRRILQPDDMRILFTDSTYVRNNVKRTAFYINAWRFIVVTGLRRGELAGLRVEDREGPNVIRINRAVNVLGEITEGKTENAQRYIALSQAARDILEDQKQLLKDHFIVSPWLFPDERGGMSDTNHIQRLWNSYRKQHSIQCTLHELRHTFMSAVKSDMPEPLLKAQVGHGAKTDSLGIYGHKIDGDIEATATVIDNVFMRLLDK